MTRSQSKDARSSSAVVAWICGMLFVVYLGCPCIFALPFHLLYGKAGAAPAGVQRLFAVVFYPVRWLDDHFTAYDSLIAKEEQIFGIEAHEASF